MSIPSASRSKRSEIEDRIPLIIEENTAFLRTYIYSRVISGRKVEMLSSLPRANNAWSSLPQSSAVQSIGGFGGRKAGTKARGWSPAVNMVT